MPLIDVPTVHAVTDTPILEDPGFLIKANAVFRALGPAGAVHIRGHGTRTADLYGFAMALAPLQETTGCWLVINDRVDVALATHARAAQLPQRGLSIEDARGVTESLPLGASVSEASAAAGAMTAGAAWVMAGNIYATQSHPGRPARGETFVRALTATRATVIAIGGVMPVHARVLKAMGCHGVATVSGIWHADDPGAAAAEYLSQIS